MYSLLGYFYKQARFLRKLGVKQYLKYTFSPLNSVIQIYFLKHKFLVRPGTTDLQVALTCFDGEFEALRYLLPREFDGTIIDAGGYIGTAALAMSEIYPSATIVTIEPVSHNFELLCKNVANNPNIVSIFGALTSKDNEKVMIADRGTGEWGFTIIENPNDVKNPELVDYTPTYSLRSIFDHYSNVGILKLDIEGAETDLFINDSISLEKIPVIFAELHDRIVENCTIEFMNFSKNRLVIKSGGEKYLSISRDVLKG